MGVMTDLKAITPTNTAVAAAYAAGTNINDLLRNAQAHVSELQLFLADAAKKLPSNDATVTAINGVLTDLA